MPELHTIKYGHPNYKYYATVVPKFELLIYLTAQSTHMIVASCSTFLYLTHVLAFSLFTIPSFFSNLPSGIIVFHPEEVDIEF